MLRVPTTSIARLSWRLGGRQGVVGKGSKVSSDSLASLLPTDEALYINKLLASLSCSRTSYIYVLVLLSLTVSPILVIFFGLPLTLPCTILPCVASYALEFVSHWGHTSPTPSELPELKGSLGFFSTSEPQVP